MGAFFTKYLGVNWKTNLAAIFSFLATVPSLVTAVQNWAAHQPVDWRGALVGVIVSAGFAVSKDSSTHSTPAQVEAAQAKVDATTTTEVKSAQVQAKEADKEAKDAASK